MRSASSASRGSRARSPTRARPSTTSTRPAVSTAATTHPAPTGRWATSEGTARIFLRDRIDWLVERDYGEYGEIEPARNGDGKRGKGSVFETEFSSSRQLVAWLLAGASNAAVLEPPELAAEAEERRELLREPPLERLQDRQAGRHARGRRGRAPQPLERQDRDRDPAGALRPPRHPRRDADRLRPQRPASSRPPTSATSSGSTVKELASDIDVLNVVNFGGGTYVLYAEVVGDEIEVDPEAYGDSFARPAAAAAARGEGAGRRDRPLRRPPAAGGARHRPREDRRGARPRPLRGGPADHRSSATIPRSSRAVNDAIAYQLGPEDQLLQGERGPVHLARDRALPARPRSRRLVRRLPRPQARRGPPLPARPDQGGGADRRQLRADRPTSTSSPSSSG